MASLITFLQDRWKQLQCNVICSEKRTDLVGNVHWQDQLPVGERKLEVLPDKFDRVLICLGVNSLQLSNYRG